MAAQLNLQHKLPQGYRQNRNYQNGLTLEDLSQPKIFVLNVLPRVDIVPISVPGTGNATPINKYIAPTREQILQRYIFESNLWRDCGTYWLNLAPQGSEDWHHNR